MKKKTDYFKLFRNVAVAIFITCLVFGGTILIWFRPDGAGTFGDSFGAINAIFSGLTVAGLIITILMQRDEIKMQRKEMSLQRREMKDSRHEFLLNRTTTVIYNQLERAERAIQNFSISSDNTRYSGDFALNKLDRIRVNYTFEQGGKNPILIYKSYSTELNLLAQSLHAAIKGGIQSILTSDLSTEEQNRLKALFLGNLNEANFILFANILTTIIEYSGKTLRDENISEIAEEWLWNLEIAKMYLNPIVSIRNASFTNDNIEAIKKSWLEKQKEPVSY